MSLLSLESSAAGQVSPRRDAGRASPFEASVVQGAGDLAALAPEWAALEALSEGAVLFQSFGWARAIIDFRQGDAGFTPLVATLRRGGELVAVLPLERVRLRFRRALVPLGGVFGQYADVLLRPGTDPADAVPALIAAALDAAPADLVSFLKVRADSTLARGLPVSALPVGTAEAAPLVDLRPFAGFDAYFATITAKTRKNMRNARNRLEREGALDHRVATTGADAAGIIARTLQGRAGRLKDQGLTSRAFADAAFARFCAALARNPPPGISLLALSLTHAGAPLAEQWGFVHGGRYYAFIASRDFGHSEESPGKLHLKEVIAACAARGIGVADLMVPSMPYKLTWATATVAVNDYALPVTWRGRLAALMWERHLRPRLKRAVLGLPPSLRRRLMAFAGRD